MKYSYLSIILAGAIFASCKPTIEAPVPDKGNADFTTYVAVGNSLTAGYADGSLYRSGQENSYPAMLAAQFKMVGGGDFKQPLLPGEAGWPGLRRVLGYSKGCDGVTGLGPILYNAQIDTAGSIINIASQGPFNNVGVPGIRCIDYTTAGYAYGALVLGGVGYAYRFYPSPLTDRPIDVATKLNPTFFSMWLGSNDVLGYATNGGEGNGAGGTLPTDISPLSAFQSVYQSVVGAMVSKGAKGVLINIPDVTAIPFFTTVPAKGLALTSDAQVAALNTAYAPLGINFTLGANYFIIQDAAAPGGLRQIKSGEYILLTIPQDSIKCKGWGSSKPIPRKYVLDATEVANVQTATAAFNAVIKTAADANGLAYVDANTYLRTLQTGIKYNGVTYSPTFVSGGAFSLDGVHLTPRGYALIANQIISAINSKYAARISSVDVNKYDGVLFP
ncbi:MAG: SGNH/GDSL hydrolase family protein [Chitinophagaceae bacterium]|jgi:lysophospholipase L1-like esterase